MPEEDANIPEDTGKKEGQKPTTWLFPRLPVRDVKFLAAKLAEEGQGEKVRRTSLLDVCNLHDSGSTRDKIIVSQSYGLTKGGTTSEFIEPTELGKDFVDQNFSISMFLDLISHNEYFKKFHDRYTGKRVPSETTMVDWAKQIGVPDVQTTAFCNVILKNATDAGLIARRSGADTFISFDEAHEILEDSNTAQANTQKLAENVTQATEHSHGVASPKTPDNKDEAQNGVTQLPVVTGFSPTIHIDVQVHISPESTPEQINAIFAGMAKHLYGRESS